SLHYWNRLFVLVQRHKGKHSLNSHFPSLFIHLFQKDLYFYFDACSSHAMYTCHSLDNTSIWHGFLEVNSISRNRYEALSAQARRRQKRFFVHNWHRLSTLQRIVVIGQRGIYRSTYPGF